MSDQTPFRDQNLLRKLRRMRVLVIHPDDEERGMFLAHMKRIGCQVESIWPAPRSLPEHIDVVMFMLHKMEESQNLAWLSGDDSIAKIAIISFETPEILSELQRLSVHGVLTKPIRLFGVLAVLTTAIGLANLEARLKRRIRSLDDTLKSRRTIERAVKILSATKGISEDEAYKRLRDKSQNSKMPITSIAEAIIASSDI